MKNLRSHTTLLLVVAGFLYSSWPLGYWLNPQADHGLASNLEALHQPYNWAFILFDITSGVLICVAAKELFAVSARNISHRTSLGLGVAIVGTATFGLFTAVDAVTPLDCMEGSPHCVAPLHNPYFLIHGIFSIGSIAGLTVSIVAIWLLLFLREQAVNSLAHLTPAMFLIVWVGFGVLTLYLILHHQTSGVAQHLFIAFCSLWLMTFPYFVRLVIRLQPPIKCESLPFISDNQCVARREA